MSCEKSNTCICDDCKERRALQNEVAQLRGECANLKDLNIKALRELVTLRDEAFSARRAAEESDKANHCLHLRSEALCHQVDAVTVERDGLKESLFKEQAHFKKAISEKNKEIDAVYACLCQTTCKRMVERTILAAEMPRTIERHRVSIPDGTREDLRSFLAGRGLTCHELDGVVALLDDPAFDYFGFGRGVVHLKENGEVRRYTRFNRRTPTHSNFNI